MTELKLGYITAPVGTSLPAPNFIGDGDLPNSSCEARSRVLLEKLTCFFTGAVAGTAVRALSKFEDTGGDKCVPAAILLGSFEYLRLGVRRMERTS